MPCPNDELEVGGTQYYYVADERHRYWVQKGKSVCDGECVWKVKADRQGREFYVNVGDRRKVWRLPDVTADDDSGPPSEALSAFKKQQQQTEQILATLSSPGAHAHQRRQIHATPPAQLPPTTDPQLSQAHQTIQYLWAELQRAAVEVDETRQIANETRVECEKLKETMQELASERDQYRSQLTTVASDVSRLTEALDQSTVDGDDKQPPYTASTMSSPAVVNPTKVLLISVSYTSHNQTFTALDEVGNPAGVYSPLPSASQDTTELHSYLTRTGYAPPAVVHHLTDTTTSQSQLPTKANIMAGIDWLVMGARPGDQLVLHIKAHGKSIGEAGCLLPVDCTSAGVVRGEALLTVLCRLPHGVRVIIVADCPQEVDLFELPHRVVASEDGMAEWDKQPMGRGFPMSADVVVVSARCAAGAISRGQSVTRAILEALERHHTASYLQLVVDVHRLMYIGDPTVKITPVISCNRQFDPSAMFPRLSGNPKQGGEVDLPPFQSLAIQHSSSQSRANNIATALNLIHSDKESDRLSKRSQRSRSGSGYQNPLPRHDTLRETRDGRQFGSAMLDVLQTPRVLHRKPTGSNPLHEVPPNTLHRSPSSPPDWNPPGSLAVPYFNNRQY